MAWHTRSQPQGQAQPPGSRDDADVCHAACVTNLTPAPGHPTIKSWVSVTIAKTHRTLSRTAAVMLWKFSTGSCSLLHVISKGLFPATPLAHPLSKVSILLRAPPSSMPCFRQGRLFHDVWSKHRCLGARCAEASEEPHQWGTGSQDNQGLVIGSGVSRVLQLILLEHV
jgi:hypothetical protein